MGMCCRYQGTGIRIEDEALITETGCEVLTGSMPKEIKQIESLLNNYSHGMGMKDHNNIKAATSSRFLGNCWAKVVTCWQWKTFLRLCLFQSQGDMVSFHANVSSFPAKIAYHVASMHTPQLL